MITSEYKGFTIVASYDQRFYICQHQFNSNGYAALNNAKGAITKHLQACQRDEDYWDDVCKMAWQDQCEADAKACAGNGADVLSVPVAQNTIAVTNNPIRDFWYDKLMNTPAQKTVKVTQSRNKREGRYCGKSVMRLFIGYGKDKVLEKFHSRCRDYRL